MQFPKNSNFWSTSLSFVKFNAINVPAHYPQRVMAKSEKWKINVWSKRISIAHIAVQQLSAKKNCLNLSIILLFNMPQKLSLIQTSVVLKGNLQLVLILSWFLEPSIIFYHTIVFKKWLIQSCSSLQRIYGQNLKFIIFLLSSYCNISWSFCTLSGHFGCWDKFCCGYIRVGMYFVLVELNLC